MAGVTRQDQSRRQLLTVRARTLPDTGNMIQVRMAWENLHSFERVPLSYEAASKRSSTAVAAVSATRTCRPIQARDVALQAVSGKIFNYLACEVHSALRAQFECTSFLCLDQPCARHQATVFAPNQRHAMTTAVSPLDITIESLDCLRMRKEHAARTTALCHPSRQCNFRICWNSAGKGRELSNEDQLRPRSV